MRLPKKQHRKLRFEWPEFRSRLAVEIIRLTNNNAKAKEWIANYEGPLRYHHRRDRTPGWVANWLFKQTAAAAGHPLIRITEDTWVEMFEPMQNHIDPKCGDWEYETYGSELRYVLRCNEEYPNIVRTVLDVDGKTRLGNGFHTVNRLNYVITRYPCPPGWQIDLPW